MTMTLASPKKSLREVVHENEMYSDVVAEINKKLALRDAIDRANAAIATGIASRGQPSEAGEEVKSQARSIFSQNRLSARPSQADAASIANRSQAQASALSKYSLASIS